MAKQRRRGKTGRRLNLSYTLVRLLERVETEGKRISLVTTADRCFFIIAQRSECRGEKQDKRKWL
jgi:hypothetical protein